MTMPQRTVQRIDWAALGWLFLFFWYFSGLLQLLIQISGFSIFVGLRQSFLVSLLWLAPVLLFPQHTKKITASIGMLLWLTSLPPFIYYLIYQQEFSQSVIFILFESNHAEGSEYFEQYFSWWVALAVIAYSVGAYLLWRQVRPVYLKRPTQWAFALFFIFSSVGYQAINQYLKKPILSEALSTYQKRLEPAAFWQIAIGYISYRQQLKNMQALLEMNNKIPPLEQLTDATEGTPSTLVLVIGESTNRQRMSLYGYSRSTTPQLDAMRDQLIAFDNVVTPLPYTIEALQQVLTFADEENPQRYLTHPSLINMMQQAGYKTFWITNQQTLTERNTMLTVFSKQADEQVYLNNNREQNARQYDTAVFEPFSAALADAAPRKLIIIHLLGTHMKYEYRYPKDYVVFNDNTDTHKHLKNNQLDIYNSYDNAVHFNDYVVATLIKSFSDSDPNGFLMYLSDHGEAVYDAAHPEVLGRSAGAPTSSMYTIPMILWLSPQWKNNFPRDYTQTTSRPYNTSDFIYTWADLAGLHFSGFDASRSIVNSKYVARSVFKDDPIKDAFAKY